MAVYSNHARNINKKSHYGIEARAKKSNKIRKDKRFDEKPEGFKNLVYIFMKNNPNKGKSEVADRFMAIVIKRATIYRRTKKKHQKKKRQWSTC